MRLAPAVAIGIASSMAVAFACDIAHQAIVGFPLPVTFSTMAILLAGLAFAALLGGVVAALLATTQKAKAGVCVAVWFALKGVYVAWRFWSYDELPYHIVNTIVPAVAAIAGARLAIQFRGSTHSGSKTAA